MATVLELIRQGAKRYGLSPVALVAVAMGEGGTDYGAVGDSGTSYGPFQLRGRDAPGGGASPLSVAETRARQNSPWIVNEPLRQIAALDIGHLSPAQQVEHIIRRFERPADPDGSVARALGRLQDGSAVARLKSGGGADFSGTFEMGFDGEPFDRPGSQVLAENQPDFLGLLNDPSGVLDTGGKQSPKGFLLSALTQEGGVQSQDLLKLSMLHRQQAQDQRTQTDIANAEMAEGQGAKRPRPATTKSGPSSKEWGQLKGIGNTTPEFMLRAIRKAQDLGLSVRENPYVDPVDPVHVEGSFHHQNFPGTYDGKKLGRALDVSGSPEAMEAFFRWAIRFRPSELFHDPLGQYDNGRYSSKGIGNHDKHVHLSV